MNYAKPTPEMVEQLRSLVSGQVYFGADIKDDYTHDEMPIYGKYAPDAVVEVATTDEVAGVCRLCYENDIPVIPRGAGTGLCGGCVAVHGGVLIDMTKMNTILGYDLENFIVRAQSGVLLEELATDCLAHGVMYPPDPGEKFATIGGNVAVNAGGMRAVKYGTTRDYVRAMTVVLPNGEVVRLGSEVSKTSTGYNLMNLMIGSEGTLGIITELSLKVIPPPIQTISLLAMFADLETCIACVPKIKMAGLDPQALEFLPRNNVDEIHEFLGKKIYPGTIGGEEVGAYLLTTFDCRTESEMDLTMEHASETFIENGALDIMVFDTPEALRSVWSVRSATLEALLAKYTLMDECDVVVPIPKIAEYVNYVTGLEKEIGLDIRATGHAGDGNVHANICAKVGEIEKEEFLKKAERFMELAYAKSDELHGSISGEHGIGSAKIPYLEKSMGQTTMMLMQGIKKVFDPKMLLNPGKICPVEAL